MRLRVAVLYGGGRLCQNVARILAGVKLFIAVENKAGVAQDTPRVEFPRGPCFWEVRGDGAWSVQPQ